MIIDTILNQCNKRYKSLEREQCENCSYDSHCPHNCEKCLDYIHNPNHAPNGAPNRKYDCTHMADFYTCKYSCRYTSEIIYALKRCDGLQKAKKLKVLSFGCGPCTDLFAIDALKKENIFTYGDIEYRGVDYSPNVWKFIHKDISSFKSIHCKINFFYKDACDLIHKIAAGNWTPNLVFFQYVFSDMRKHSDPSAINNFIKIFAEYYNTKTMSNTYIILNDINLGYQYGGGRDYFDRLYSNLNNSVCRKGRFCNDNATSTYYPRGYPYGEDSDGEFPQNKNLFNLNPWKNYSPFNTCASAQMIIKKEVEA